MLISKRYLIVGLLAVSIFILEAPAQAKYNWKARRIDRNKDGTIDKYERRMEKQLQEKKQCQEKERARWRNRLNKVNTGLEKKYDADGDGWLQPAEAKKLLQYKYTMIKTEGKAKVDSAIEAEYDTNGDGIISGTEAKNLKQDLDQ